eukprot:Nitzschia sp. Nitz4//scaffold293_size23253//14724//16078//NITZ4_008507-RA/size23253-processed-gene-0.12-mRNA-1//1//CDS//3329546201//9249//frame0
MAGQVAPKSPRHNRSYRGNQLVCARAQNISNRYLSRFELPEPVESLPTLELEDIKRGEVLGKGGFGTVYAVKRIDSSIVDEDSTTEYSFNSDKEARYALKVVNAKALISDEDLFNTLMDNATEAKLLGSLNHPNILKIRATPASGMFSEHSFLLLDRLEGTLRERLRREWKPTSATMKRVQGIIGKVLNRVTPGHKEASFWNKRVQYAGDLASALAYMHSHRVVHRDLKPENIGFDRDNNLKIFDFGLARQLPQPETSDETVFKMTGHCGSPRYMAPEVALDHRYNEKVDVYSFSLLLWEILSLETPYMGVNKQYLKTNVWRGRHVRPKLNGTWSSSLQGLLNAAWHRDETKRPSMTEIRDRLREEVCWCNKKEIESPSSKARRAWLDRPRSKVLTHGIQDETFSKNTPTSRAA